MPEAEDDEWIKIDLHIHTLDDPKDALDYSAHELLERARVLGGPILVAGSLFLVGEAEPSQTGRIRPGCGETRE